MSIRPKYALQTYFFTSQYGIWPYYQREETNILCQGMPSPPSIFIDNTMLEVVHPFNCLGSTATDNLSLDAELDIRLGKAATNLAVSLEYGTTQS